MRVVPPHRRLRYRAPEIGEDIAPGLDRDHVAIAQLERRPGAGDAAVVIDRLTVRSDQVDFVGRDSCVLECCEAGRGKRLADPDVELGNRANIELGGAEHLALDVGIVGVLAIMEQLDASLAPMSHDPANGDVDRVGACAGNQSDDCARRLVAAFD